MSSSNDSTSTRPALQDASNRINQTPVPPPVLPPFALKAPGAPPVFTTTTTSAPKAVASRKRKKETSLDDDIAAYKKDLSHIPVEHLPIDMTCNQVRAKINKLLDSDIMKKGEFCKAIGSNANSVNTFLSKRGTMDGSGSLVYVNAWDWFKRREIAGLKMPDVKKRQKTAAAAAAAAATTSTSSAGLSGANRAAAAPVSGPDLSNIHLPGEETDSVPVYDTCDEIRKKINAHLKTPGLTAAQFCRDIYAQLNQPKIKCFQTKQLSDFRGKKGPNAGCTSQIFYAAYVYFEKKRIAEGKPKSQHRLNMEKIWAKEGGFDREHDGRHGIWLGNDETFYLDQYGQIHIERLAR